MISRRAWIYVAAFAAAAVGLRLMFSSGPNAADAASGSAGSVLKTRPGHAEPHGRGGYMGTGRAQVQLEGDAKTVAPPAQSLTSKEVRSPQAMNGDRRMDDLKRVLENIDGEPVYVEGVDGPIPEKKRK